MLCMCHMMASGTRLKVVVYHVLEWVSRVEHNRTQHAFYFKLVHLSVIVSVTYDHAAILQDASSADIRRWVKREAAVGSDTARNIRCPENIIFKNTHFIETALDSKYLAHFSFGRHTTKWGFCRKQVKNQLITPFTMQVNIPGMIALLHLIHFFHHTKVLFVLLDGFGFLIQPLNDQTKE